MAEYRKVEDLSLEDLREEVWFWRTDAAAGLASMIAERQARPPSEAEAEESEGLLAYAAEALHDALRGRYHERCFACGFSIQPGDAVISDVNEGEMHASCPDQEGGAQAIKPGDKVFMDRDSIVIDQDHPEGGEASEKPDHIVAHEATRLYTHEQIVAKVTTAMAKAEGVG